jgi:non-lysosomal glucosylceramidase
VRRTLKSIFKYNYKSDLSDYASLQRTYAINEEGGVLLAAYPLGKRPEIPFPYFCEVWTGSEYQFAAALTFEGMMTEALAVVETVRQRFDGERRNPWNDQECGHHYARALSSWACFLAWSGFRYSAPQRELTLMPRSRRQMFRCFWSTHSGWGSYTHTLVPQGQQVKVQVAEGTMAVGRLAVNGIVKRQLKNVSVRWGTNALESTLKQEPLRRLVTFERELIVTPDHPLEVVLAV